MPNADVTTATATAAVTATRCSGVVQRDVPGNLPERLAHCRSDFDPILRAHKRRGAKTPDRTQRPVRGAYYTLHYTTAFQRDWPAAP